MTARPCVCMDSRQCLKISVMWRGNCDKLDSKAVKEFDPLGPQEQTRSLLFRAPLCVRKEKRGD